jgi:hypothetical protein
MSGIKALQGIRRSKLDFRVPGLTLHEEPDLVCRSFRAGADEYMLKKGIAKELVAALRAVLGDEVYFSLLMQKDLLSACRIKSFAGHEGETEIIHCGKTPSAAQSLANTNPVEQIGDQSKQLCSRSFGLTLCSVRHHPAARIVRKKRKGSKIHWSPIVRSRFYRRERSLWYKIVIF